MEGERPHRSGSSELFICFTSRLSSSSSSMRIPAKSIHSPGRPEKFRDGSSSAAASLHTSLSRRLRHNGSLRGGQSSPMFPTTGKKKGSSFETPEPTSPKVTCIGQVRVKTKKQGKKMRTRSKKRGELSFRKSFEGGDGAVEEERLGRRNQKWVSLPLSICEALRAFGADFNCFQPCGGGSACGSSGVEREKGEKRSTATSTSTCGAVFARWLMTLQEGEEEKRRQVEKVAVMVEEGKEVGEREDVKAPLDDCGEIPVEMDDNVQECIPPKNALLLMRCRSEPLRMASYAQRFWESPAAKEVEEDEDDEVEEDDKDGEDECGEEEVDEEEADEEEREEEVSEEIRGNEELDQGCREETMSDSAAIAGAPVSCEEETTETEEIVAKEGEKLGKDEEPLEEAPSTENQGNPVSETISSAEMPPVLAESSIEEVVDNLQDPTEEEVESSQIEPQDSEEAENGIKEEPRLNNTEEEEEDEDTDAGLVTAAEDLEEEERIENEKTTAGEGEKRMSTSSSSSSSSSPPQVRVQFGEQAVSSVEEKPVEDEATGAIEDEKATALSQTPAAAAAEREEKVVESERQSSRETAAEQREERDTSLPDCLLLMLCEPKLSMEVSKETWVCSTDFLRWRPERKPRATRDGGADEAKRASTDSNPAHPPVTSVPGAEAEQPPPAPPLPRPPPPSAACSAQSMAAAVEQKLGNASAYEPFVLTRCKSEPMRSSAKLAPEACFWKSRKLEPQHHAVGVGTAGIGF